MNQLAQYRKRLDALDSQLLRKLQQRFVLSQRIQKYKKREGLQNQDIKREKEIIQKMIKQNKGIIPIARLKRMASEIIRFCSHR